MVPWGNFSLPEYMVKLKSNVVPRFHLNKFQTLCTRHPQPQPGSSNHKPVERALTISYKAALWYWYNRRYLFVRTKYWVVLGPQIILQFFCHNFDVADCDHHCITYTWTHYFLFTNHTLQLFFYLTHAVLKLACEFKSLFHSAKLACEFKQVIVLFITKLLGYLIESNKITCL